MPLSKKRLAKEIVRASLSFHALRPWEEFEYEDVVAIAIPGLEHPAVASILGADGDEFGLSLYLGENAAVKLLEHVQDDLPEEDSVIVDRILAFSMKPLGDIPAWARAPLEQAGFQGRREAPAPWIVAKRRDHSAHRASRDELEILLFATRGMIEALERDLVEPVGLGDEESSPLLVLSGDPRSPEVRVDRIAFDLSGPEEAPPPVEAPDEARGLPRREVTWQVGLPILPTTVRGEERVTRAVLILEPESGVPLGSRVVMNESEAGREFYRIVLEPASDGIEPHLPREVLFRSPSLFRLVAPSLRALGVESRTERVLPELEEATDDLVAHLAGGTAGIPAPDDLGGWKKADVGFTSRVPEYLGYDLIRDNRALDAFFGAGRESWKLFEDRFSEGTGPAYFEWLLVHHRPAPVGPRTGERILASGRLAPVERTLLRNRLRGRISVYRVDDMGPEGRVGLVDVLDGSRHEIRDFSLAATEMALDCCVAISIFRAGAFRFGSLLGPAISAPMVDEALDLLERHASPLTPETLSTRAGAIGRLWGWWERIQEKPRPILRFLNSERHVVSLREATFLVENPAALAEALLSKEEFSIDGGSVIWAREMGAEAPMRAGLIMRGQIRFKRGEMLAETNSVERMAELRRHLEALPGVRPGPERDVTPPDMREAGETAGAEVRELIFDQYYGEGRDDAEAGWNMPRWIREHYLEWVDRERSELGGRTPRQVCETEEGRRRIRRRIYAMRRPSGLRKEGLDLPREEMLSALGLPAGPAWP